MKGKGVRLAKGDSLMSTSVAAHAVGISVAQFRRVVAERGIEPDGTYTNPHHRSGPPAHLWSRKTVGRVKRMTAVRGAAERSKRAHDAANTRFDKTLAQARAWVPKVVVWDLVKVKAAAFDSYDARQEEIGRYDRRASGEDPDFTRRIMTNFIRHELTDYEETLAAMKGRTGGADAYEIVLRPIVDCAIEDAYPMLAGFDE